jgi:hypothetical protein
MPTLYGPLDLVKNEFRNAVVQNLGTAPAAPVKGLLYFSTADNTLYWYDGTQWIAAKAAAGAIPSDTVTTAAIGDAPVAGASTLFARGDHKHGMPAFAAITVEQTFGSAATNGASTSLARADHAHGNPTHDAAAHATIPVSALAAATASLNMAGQRITVLGTPTQFNDASTKQYVDDMVAGLAWKDSVRVASTANIATLSGLLTVDGVIVAPNDRVLVKNQTTASANGIYVAASSVWTRATDADIESKLVNATVFVSEGTTLADTAWTMTTNAPITLNGTNLVWVQFAGGTTFNAGTGLTLTGNTFDVGAGTGITVAADAVAVDTAVIATRSYVDTAVTGATKKFAAALTGTASPETVTHNLNTRDVFVQVVNGATPYSAVEVDWDATTVNTVTVRYNPNLGAGYRVAVLG